MKMKGISIVVIAMFLVASVDPAGMKPSNMPSGIKAASSSWFDPRWHHGIILNVSANGITRDNYPVDINVDFTPYINSTDIIDVNSLRVFLGSNEIPSEYHAITSKAGNLVFTTGKSMGTEESLIFTIYYDVETNGLKPVPDYGPAKYIINDQKLFDIFKSLGSSPDGGDYARWIFPPGLTYSHYEYGDKHVGPVRSWYTAWGDAWSNRGTDHAKCVRHYARATVYNGSTIGYVTVWNNASMPEKAYASSIGNISTGRVPEVAETGLHVITNDWAVNNIAALNYANPPETENPMASGLENGGPGPYNQLLDETFTFTYSAGTDSYVIDPETDSVVPGTWKIVGSESGDVTGLSAIQLDDATKSDEVTFAEAMFDGEQFTLTYQRYLYQFSDALNVVPRIAKNLQYLIAYDSTDKHGAPIAKPQIATVIFPDNTVAAAQTVIEFWQNETDPTPPVIPPLGKIPENTNYFINMSVNYNEWWYNATDRPNLHNLQDNTFKFVLYYSNVTSGIVGRTTNIRDGYNKPATIVISSVNDALPIVITVNSPKSGDYFSTIDMVGFPANPYMSIDATITGDTIAAIYYKLGDSAPSIEFHGTATVSVTDIYADSIGNANIWIIAQDTNGTNITVKIPIKVATNYFQEFSIVSGAFVTFLVLLGIFAFIFVWLGALNIKKRKWSSDLSIDT